jgi:hypothetical protein
VGILHDAQQIQNQHLISLVHHFVPSLAIADVLFGHATPSGKTTYTWPRTLSDSPSYGNFPCNEESLKLDYAEGLFMGWKGYERDGWAEPAFGTCV